MFLQRPFFAKTKVKVKIFFFVCHNHSNKILILLKTILPFIFWGLKKNTKNTRSIQLRIVQAQTIALGQTASLAITYHTSTWHCTSKAIDPPLPTQCFYPPLYPAIKFQGGQHRLISFCKYLVSGLHWIISLSFCSFSYNGVYQDV